MITINFFINGFPKYKEDGIYMQFYLDQHIAITESNENAGKCVFASALSSANKISQANETICNYVQYENKQNKLETDIIYLPVIEGIYVLEIKVQSKYDTYTYTVYENSIPKYYGKFRIEVNQPKICFLSCNSSNVTGKGVCPLWTLYYGKKDKNWKAVYDEQPDLIIHLGDQIYADAGLIPRSKFRQMYINAYSKEWQGKAMRNCINLTILDDHEIYNDWQHVHEPNASEKDRKLIEEGLKYYLLYQPTKSTSEFFSYNYQIGKYEIIFMDMAYELYKTGTIFTEKNMDFAKKILTTTDKQDVIFILPRPLYYYTDGMLQIFKLFFQKSYRITPMADNNRDGTFMFLNLVNDSDKNIVFVCGDIHHTSKFDIVLSKKIINQFIFSAITMTTFNPFSWMNITHEHNYRKYGNIQNPTKYKRNNFGILYDDVMTINYFTLHDIKKLDFNIAPKK